MSQGASPSVPDLRLPSPRLIAAIATIPLVIVMIVMLRHHWYPTGDLAHTELMLRAIPRHPPLVGVAARVGPIDDQGSALGPSMAYAMLPVYVLLGRSSWATIAAADVLHGLAIGASVWLVGRRHGRWAAIATAFVMLVMVRALMTSFFVEPWNVWLPVFAFAAFLVLLWDVAQERSRSLPWAVAVGSHCGQTHVSYLPLVGGLTGLALVWLLIRRRTVQGGPRRLGRDIVVSAAVGAISLVAPVYEQLTRSPGNLRRLWQHFGNPPEPYVGVRAGVKAFAGEFNLLGSWVTGRHHEPTASPNLVGLLAMVALVAGGVWVAWRRRDREALALFAVCGAATAIGLFSVTRVFGEFYDYVVRWVWPINAIAALAALLAIGRAATDRWPGHLPRLARWAVVMPVLLVVAAGLQATGARPPHESDSRLVGGLSGPLADHLSPDARYLLRWHDPAALGGVPYGLVLEMERRGMHVGVDAWGKAAAQPFRVQAEETASTVLWYISGDRSIAKFAERADAVLLASFDPRSAADQARSDEVRALIESRLTELGRAELIRRLDEQYGTTQIRFFEKLPADVVDLVTEYNDLREPGAVFEVPTFAPLFTAS